SSRLERGILFSSSSPRGVTASFAGSFLSRVAWPTTHLLLVLSPLKVQPERSLPLNGLTTLSLSAPLPGRAMAARNNRTGLKENLGDMGTPFLWRRERISYFTFRKMFMRCVVPRVTKFFGRFLEPGSA